MGLNSTRFISYRDINVGQIDLIEDAWGFAAVYGDVIGMLQSIQVVPEKDLSEKLIQIIRRHL